MIHQVELEVKILRRGWSGRIDKRPFCRDWPFGNGMENV